ncbi:MAG: hypothetical protein SOT64_02520, partial [Candidatus Faecousia sp.]|nr:hypothetical protein [Candidatus Faecousia sp.]
EKEAEEARIRAEQLARDREILAPEITELERFSGALEARKTLRAETIARAAAEQAAWEEERARRRAARQAAGK